MGHGKIEQQLNKAKRMEQVKQWQEAKALYSAILTQDSCHEAAHRGLIRVLTQELHEFGRSPERIHEGFVALQRAYQAGIQSPDIVVPLAKLYWEKNQKETGVRLVEAYFQRETDVTQLLQAFFEVTYILHTEIPSDYANILRLHTVILEQTAIPLSPYDRLRSYLTRAPNDLRDAYFSTGHSDEWFANVNALWGKLNRHERRELRAAYLKLTLAGHYRSGQYESALERGRQYVRYLRDHLPEPRRSSLLAQTYATLIAPAYQHLGKPMQTTRSFRRAEHYLARYERILQSDPTLTHGWSEDQFVEPYANVAAGALRCHDEAQALQFYLAAERAKPGVCVVNMFLAGLYLKVENDRQRALYYLRRALATAATLGGNALERVQLWFQEIVYFQPVQNNTEFQQLIQSALARHMSSICFES